MEDFQRRISDQEREDVADIVRRAAGEGRLTFGELEERLEIAYSSKTYGELVQITADLPQARPSQPVGPPASPTIRVFLSDAKRVGSWLVPRNQDVSAVMGDVTLDYTEADIPHPEVFIEARAILGAIKIRVPPDAIVHLDGQPILGSISEKGTRDATQPDTTPTVFYVRASTILGDVKIKRGPRLTKRLGLT